MARPTAAFKKLMDRTGIIVAPGVYDCISAKIATQLGFEAIYVGSYATGAALLGVPDTGFISRTEMIEQVWRLAGAVEVPIIADAEGGWGNPVHVASTVRAFERAGTAAIHLEDQEFGKHVTDRPVLLPISKAVDKMKAALDTRRDPHFHIIARTDALLSSELTLEHAIERAVAFGETGVDLVLVTGLGMPDLARVAAAVPVPLFNTNPFDEPAVPIAEMEQAGLKVVIYFALAHCLAYTAIHEGLRGLKRDGSLAAVADRLLTMEQFDQFLGIREVQELATRYRVFEDL